ncbi:MAG: hypothetical protein FK734_20670 [Asgard group archaeon]|nr:hypothetical protein [Asgard group archaeon]
MPTDLKNLRKNYLELSKQEIFTEIKAIRERIDLKYEQRKTEEFSEVLYLILESFSHKGDYNSERIILNQLIELAWWAEDESLSIDYLAKAITLVIIDSQSTRGMNRTKLFSDFLDIIARFPINKQIYKVISTASIELIKWGTDNELLKILDSMQEKATIYPLMETMQLLNAKVFMNILFYLEDQDCISIKKIYNQFSCFAISNFEQDINGQGTKVKSTMNDEDVNEILQEGVINAIINLARIDSKFEEHCDDCIIAMRRIIEDSEYLLKKEDKEFFQDVYRLSYTLEHYHLWDQFLDIKFIAKLKEEQDKNNVYQIAESKLLAIQKTMRIEEYDSLKIGRRGIILAYDLNNLDDIEHIAKEIVNQQNSPKTPIKLVEEIDAIIEIDEELRDHLRETGQIPADRQTIDQIQDQVTKSDDLTVAATDEAKIAEQLQYLKELESSDPKFIMNDIIHTKALIFSVGMYGFNSAKLNISRLELLKHIDKLSDKKMIIELVDPLVRAVTLRAARLDGEAVRILLELLNNKGLKFITRYYKQYNFIDNIIRLISYLGRTAQIKLLENIKSELERANRISLNDSQIPIKIARAINEGILSYTASNLEGKYSLLNLVKEIAKINSYNVNLQIKFIEGMNFIILDSGFTDESIVDNVTNELIDFASTYRNNQQIEEKAALGIFWAVLFSKINHKENKFRKYQEQIEAIINHYPNSEFLLKIDSLAKSIIPN